jgi:tight adherence protein B
MTEKLGNSYGAAALRQEGSLKLQDYRTYHMSLPEAAMAMGEGIAALAGISWLFYRSLIPAALLSPLLILWYRYCGRRAADQRRRNLALQFKNGVQALAGALSAGYSVENAFHEARRELTVVYGADGMIVQEFLAIERQLRMSMTVEAALEDFADRSGVDDIRQLAAIFGVAKRNGGRMIQILESTAATLRTKQQVREEIQTLMTAKKMESRVMDLMPVGILLYMNLTSPVFLTPLYGTLAGRATMTFCLGLYIGAVILAERMMDVKV